MILFSVLNHVFYHWTQILRSLSSTFYLYLPVSQNRPQSSCHILEPYLSNMLKFIKDNLKFLNISNSDFNVIYKYIFNIIDTKHSSFINITIHRCYLQNSSYPDYLADHCPWASTHSEHKREDKVTFQNWKSRKEPFSNVWSTFLQQKIYFLYDQCIAPEISM